MPIAPAPTGNGLAMRVSSFVTAAAVHHDVHLIVVPTAGATRTPPPPAGVRTTTLSPRDPADPREAMAWIADPQWRERYALLAPVLPVVRCAPPSMTDEVEAVLGQWRPDAVLACRLAMAVLGLALAERFDAALLIDADDDDAQYHLSRGEAAAASAVDRVARLCLP
ncbi:MAG: hypothetical protein M3N95_04815, partial [Actinomycetota bacterium]|nr:hypothetical protein [Actinomycetota bacterium]